MHDWDNTESSPLTTTMTRLNKDQVIPLTLEGGGGKGNAFPGAIEALSDPWTDDLAKWGLRPKNILGFAGASAGAITALFLSCRYDYEEIKILSGFQNFDAFFDTPKVGSGPRVGSCGPEKTPSTPEPADRIASKQYINQYNYINYLVWNFDWKICLAGFKGLSNGRLASSAGSGRRTSTTPNSLTSADSSSSRRSRG